MEAGDYKTEVHFIGQIYGGSEFDTNIGLFCEAHLDYGEAWRELPMKLETSIQTHTAYPDADEYYVWNHPLDVHFSTDSIFGWPKLELRVWRLDNVGRMDLLSYGLAALPCSPGFFELECPTWRPIGSWQEEALAFFVGGPPRLLTQDALNKQIDKRKELKTVSSGVVHLQLEVLLKNFDVHWAGSDIAHRVEH